MVYAMTRPVIGICTALEPARWSVWEQRAALVGADYFGAVQRGGGMPLLLVPDEELTADPSQALDLIDGLMLTGGADLDPASYGSEPHPATVDTVPERDAFELAMARGAIERDMPVLGICRGMQLINVALGGTLLQHLPETVGHEEHRRALGTFEGSDHDVKLEGGSLAARTTGESVHRTLSHHHQGVDCIGSGLVVSGTSTLDGLPEAIELPDRDFVLGVQWHPEADPGSPVVSALVQAAAAHIAARAA
jgi:putative glutamine amidotransferase